MKHLHQLLVIVSLACLVVDTATAQQSESGYGGEGEQYSKLKSRGWLARTMNLMSSAMPGGRTAVNAPANKELSGLLVPRDSSFSVVPFIANGGAPPQYRNDDGYSDSIPLSFGFGIFGLQVRSVYINNNGNISFGQGLSEFTSTGFPDAHHRMIAACWSDVDTRNLQSGVVYYRSDPHRFVVVWDSVGYRSFHADKRNSFEIIITDGTDPIIGFGNNMALSYADMQWTTGDMSGGQNGFGGIPATVGANGADGTNHVLVGRFDHEGTDYDGPGGQSDGVSYLDHKLFTFNIAEGVPTSWIVYPGDANNDGIVDVRDILPVGRYFGQTGPTRTGGTTWGPQTLTTPWTAVDACYADCNGDGTVNATDVGGIITNWFRTRTSQDAPQVDRVAVCEQLLREIDTRQPVGSAMLEIRNAVVSYMKRNLGVSFIHVLEQNWPNPFNPSTTIRFSVPEKTPVVTLSIYSIVGQLVWGTKLVDVLPGKHEMVWSCETLHGAKAASGTYVYRLTAGSYSAVKRMLLIK